MTDLFERDHPLSQLTSLGREVRRTGGRLVLIGGEAGMGKSSLVEAFVAGLPAASPTIQTQCDPPATTTSLGVVREIADAIHGGLDSRIDPDATAQSAFPAILSSLVRRKPAVLVIEDAHWADQPTLDLILHLGRRAGLLSTLLIVTYRDDEVGVGHPLQRALGALATSDAVVRLGLKPLSLAAVAKLAAGVPVDVAAIHAQSAGNPFLVRELLDQARTGLPAGGLRDLVNERLGRLAIAPRQMVFCVAAAGRASSRLLEALSATAALDVDAAAAAGLLAPRDDGVGFRHDLVRAAVLATLSPPQRRDTHLRVLRALETSGDADSRQLAHHALGAGVIPSVRRYVPDAARRATECGAQREAAILYEAALGGLPAAHDRDRAALLIDYARVCGALDRQDDAIAALRSAVGMARALGDNSLEGACLGALALPLVRSGLNGDAEQACQRAIELLEPLGNTSELAGALRTQAHLRMLDRDKGRALHFGRRAIRMAQAIGAAETLAAAHMTVGTALLVADDLQGRHHIAHAAQSALALGRHELLSNTLLNAGSASGEQFRLDDAEGFLNEGLAVAEARDLDADVHYMQAWMALIRLHRGQLNTAVSAASALLKAQNLATISRIMALIALGRALSQLGGAGANAALAEALDLARSAGTLQRIAPVRLARAEAAWLAGDRHGARAEAESVWHLATGHRHQWFGGESVYWRHVGGDAVTPPPWIAEPYALDVRGRWGEAAAAWEALGCPFYQARSLAAGDAPAQFQVIRIYDNLGAAPAASALRQSLRRGGHKQIPRGPRAATTRDPWSLTAREAQIAQLVAAGLTNAKIAESLRISSKTVEAHVSAILAKLGVKRRVEVQHQLRVPPAIGSG